MKIKPEIQEDTNQKIGDANTSVDTKSMVNPNFRGEWGTPVTADASLHSNTNSSGNTTVQMGNSPANIVMKQHEAEGNMQMKCPEGQVWDDVSGACVPMTEKPMECSNCREEDTSQPRPEDIRSGPSRSKAPESSLPSGSLPSPVRAVTTLGSAPASIGVKVGNAPVESLPSLEERKARFKAEQRANTAEGQILEWETKHDDVYKQLLEFKDRYNQLLGINTEQLRTMQTLDNSKVDAIRELHNKEVERDSIYKKYEHELALREEYKSQVENYKNEMSRLSEKYNATLTTNLSLSQKLTKANEEYLDVAKKLESTDEALERSRIEAKKILKIRV